MRSPAHPSLYQVNTRVVLNEIGRTLARPATLDDLPDETLDEIASLGFDWVWFLGVWQTGTAARDVSRSNAEWRREYEALLSDLTDDDITCGEGRQIVFVDPATFDALDKAESLGYFLPRLVDHLSAGTSR